MAEVTTTGSRTVIALDELEMAALRRALRDAPANTVDDPDLKGLFEALGLTDG